MNAAADFWREQCFYGDRSLFWQANLWTLKNPSELQPRIEKHKPRGDENYVQKLKTQLGWGLAGRSPTGCRTALFTLSDSSRKNVAGV